MSALRPMTLSPAVHALALALLASALLTGCGQKHEDLREWMAQQRASMHPRIKPIEPPKPFIPAVYDPTIGTDPFSAAKLEVGARQEVQQLNPMLQAELARPKQPLEAYSLDQIQMVGSVKIKGQQYALLKAGNLLYRAHVGEYAGQHFGKIIKITDSEVDLRELVQDATGDWVERPATLQLQESTQ
ncbi:pilus assembly protein PilP [Thiomonas bhubaneswarensis]|uniref:Tfp pilus assembly protein PilP n=1 Tax=Thiomonas bhubaneswarensis TaxID=339866 RepID=A0A0K6HU59_9BURK|nr:pilus assembly protein PilP [Thiomonas bhubaneswarensis]CUA94376.1 Tfp pilus assembly protein PilP [Thiomonas bhubaneswarensis]